jgi:hypothetical protein
MASGRCSQRGRAASCPAAGAGQRQRHQSAAGAGQQQGLTWRRASSMLSSSSDDVSNRASGCPCPCCCRPCCCWSRTGPRLKLMLLPLLLLLLLLSAPLRMLLPLGAAAERATPAWRNCRPALYAVGGLQAKEKLSTAASSSATALRSSGCSRPAASSGCCCCSSGSPDRLLARQGAAAAAAAARRGGGACARAPARAGRQRGNRRGRRQPQRARRVSGALTSPTGARWPRCRRGSEGMAVGGHPCRQRAQAPRCWGRQPRCSATGDAPGIGEEVGRARVGWAAMEEERQEAAPTHAQLAATESPLYSREAIAAHQAAQMRRMRLPAPRAKPAQRVNPHPRRAAAPSRADPPDLTSRATLCLHHTSRPPFSPRSKPRDPGCRRYARATRSKAPALSAEPRRRPGATISRPSQRAAGEKMQGPNRLLYSLVARGTVVLAEHRCGGSGR